MNKKEFFEQIKATTKRLPKRERKDILRDMEEHFEFAEQEGMSEIEIVHTLGSPSKIGKEMVAVYNMEQVESKKSFKNIASVVWSVLGLSLLNFIIVLAPLILAVSILLSGGVISLSLSISVGVFIVNILFHPSFFEWFEFFSSLVFTGVGLLLFIVVYHLSKGFITIFIRYLKWNIRIVKKEASIQ